MAKKKLTDLTEKEKRKLGIILKSVHKYCECREPNSKIESNEMFESWYICTKCKKEII